MNKADLTRRLADEARIPYARAARVVALVLQLMREGLVGDRCLQISGFGTIDVEPGMGVRSGPHVTFVPVFRPGRRLRDQLATRPAAPSDAC